MSAIMLFCTHIVTYLNMNVFEVAVRNTRAANVRKYKTERFQNSKYKNSPFYKAAKYWDTLPRILKDCESAYELKRHLRVLHAPYDENFFLI